MNGGSPDSQVDALTRPGKAVLTEGPIGKSLIRLDCWDGNEFLKSYYQGEGFRMLEAVQEDDYFVRLYEKDVGSQ